MAEEKQADPNEGKHAPLPETIDHTKSAVTQEQVKNMEDAAPKAPGENDNGNGESHQKTGAKSGGSSKKH